MTRKHQNLLLTLWCAATLSDTSKPDKQAVFALLLAESICKEHNVKVPFNIPVHYISRPVCVCIDKGSDLLNQGYHLGICALSPTTKAEGDLPLQ
jgi:hypothetical protein